MFMLKNKKNKKALALLHRTEHILSHGRELNCRFIGPFDLARQQSIFQTISCLVTLVSQV